jgi:hypothetical protein
MALSYGQSEEEEEEEETRKRTGNKVVVQHGTTALSQNCYKVAISTCGSKS